MADFTSPRRTRRLATSPSAANPSTPFSARKKRSLECVLSPNPGSAKTLKASDLVHVEDEIRRNKKQAQPSVRESLFSSQDVDLEHALVIEILEEESQQRKSIKVPKLQTVGELKQHVARHFQLQHMCVALEAFFKAEAQSDAPDGGAEQEVLDGRQPLKDDNTQIDKLDLEEALLLKAV